MGKDWWRGAVIYQIYPRSFMDSNGDGIGDLPGITSRLEHVAALGADAIWVSPFFRSPMKDFGYDVADYREVDPIFGTLADFDALLARAHDLGLKVIIDQVLSHTSDQHAWFAASRSARPGPGNPKADWYVWADPRPDGTSPNNWLSVFGGPAWQWDSRRRQYYLHSFLPEQPDLNFHSPAVQDALLGEVRFWCERGVDGFRFDACNHQFHDARLRSNPAANGGAVSTVRADNPYAMQQHLYDKSQPENLLFLEKLRAVLDQYGAVGLGEVGDENAPPVMARYTERGKRLHLAYSFSLLTSEHSARHLRGQVEALEHALAGTDGWACWAVSNHDVPRVASRWSAGGPPDTRRDRMWLALLLSLRGSASVYQGEELGLPEAEVPFELLQDPYGRPFWPEFKGRDGCRTPLPWHADRAHAGFTSGMPWLPVSEAHGPLAIDRQAGDAGSMLQFSRRLLRWRRGQPLLRTGMMAFFDAPEPLLWFERGDGNSALQAVFNLGAEPATLKLQQALVPLDGTPFTGARLEGRLLSLPPFGVFFGEAIDPA